MRKFNTVLFIFVTGFNIMLIFCWRFQTFKITSAATMSLDLMSNTGSQFPRLCSQLSLLNRLYYQKKDCKKYADQTRLPFIDDRSIVTMFPNNSYTIDVTDEAILVQFDGPILDRVKHSFCVTIQILQLKTVTTKVASLKKFVQLLSGAVISGRGVDLTNLD